LYYITETDQNETETSQLDNTLDASNAFNDTFDQSQNVDQQQQSSNSFKLTRNYISSIVNNLTYSTNYAKNYGLVPKVQRAIVLHRYLHYLVYNYDGCEQTDTLFLDQHHTDVDNHFAREDLEILDSVQIPTSSRTFKSSLSWQTFIPPLHNRNNKGDTKQQQCLFIGEILSHMPLSVFCAIIVVNYQVPGLLALLKHPVKRHVLVKDLPTCLVAPLINERRYIRRIVANLQLLVALGLVAFAESTCKANEALNRDSQSQAVYVYRKTVFYDTTTNQCKDWNELCELNKLNFEQASTNSDFLRYEKCEFEFNSDSDVIEYWRKLVHVSMNTYKFGVGNYLKEDKQVRKKLQSFVTRKHRLEELSDVLRIESINNDGAIDNMGPGGYDSQLFLHFFQNWIIPSNVGSSSTTSSGVPGSKSKQKKDPGVEPAITKEADQSYAPYSELALSFPFGVFRGLATVTNSSSNHNAEKTSTSSPNKSNSAKRKRPSRKSSDDDEDTEADSEYDSAVSTPSPRKKAITSINAKLITANASSKSKGKLVPDFKSSLKTLLKPKRTI
jgi:hypothetical protein